MQATANSEPLSYRVDDACRALGIGRTTLYGLIACGQLKAIKIAGRTLIPRSEIERLVAEAMADA
ncbi:MAG: helix-turn-helix domain-containing protein [Ancalomicrobiaceae bacterium]|nr:helix-turn-helix domain-containing protein [Ancalomicrobiaceae bacterium]